MYIVLHILKSWNSNFKTFLVLALVVFSVSGFSQNKGLNTFSSNGISEIIINGDQIFKIKVTTEKSDIITVTSTSDGEYGNDYKVVSEVKGKQLFISLKRIALEKMPDDKRNAHKVITADLELKLPDNMNLSITSDVGSVEAKGKFNRLNVNLFQGGCTIEGLARVGTIKTVDEPILIRTKNAIIQTDSHHGLVEFPSDMLGTNLWRLTTIGGNITVKKIDK